MKRCILGIGCSWLDAALQNLSILYQMWTFEFEFDVRIEISANMFKS